MGKNRKRFNEAARSHKHGEQPILAEFDPNAELLDPTQLSVLSEAAKPKQEQLPDGMSKKKRKRFEQFLAKKAKKEERVELLKQLSSSSFDHKLLFSSARLGTAKLSKKEALNRALLEKKCGLVPSHDLYVQLKNADDEMPDDASQSDESITDIPTNNVAIPVESSTACDSLSVRKRRKKSTKKSNGDTPAPQAPTSFRIDDSDDDNPLVVVPNAALDATRLSKPKVYEVPDRDPEIAQRRLLLPVCQEEDLVMETINSNPVTVICGETGSGKTTQVPQFLYEAGYSHPDSDYPGLIGVTQPRRVAAVSMSQRVGIELNKKDHVSYQIRFDKTNTSNTRIHFMTDGVLLKQVSQDLLLSQYSVIVVDEAHERNLNTDILIGVLSRVVTLRAKLAAEWTARSVTASRLGEQVTDTRRVMPLKLVIMSATLRISDFTMNSQLFSTPPPVINVQARQFPVTVHFNRRTPDNHMVDAYHKVCKIHKRLPPGGILVFLTGQNEIHDLVTRLRKKFDTVYKEPSSQMSHGESNSRKRKVNKGLSKERCFAKSLGSAGRHDIIENDPNASIEERISEVDTGIAVHTSVPIQILSAERTAKNGDIVQLQTPNSKTSDNEQQVFLEDNEEEFMLSDDETDTESNYKEMDQDDFDEDDGPATPMLVLPLYSLLPTEQQMRVFDQVPDGYRLCVVATNVAETSLTIPGVRYVVDCGKVKEKTFDSATSIQKYSINWTAKSSADQRAGRSGRTGPGHCYRLYSSAVYERQFPAFSEPEVLRMPIEGVVLQLKSMNIDKVVGFPFPTPPNRGDLHVAEKLLQSLGALNDQGQVTPVGMRMSQLPIHPRFAKMLLLGLQSRQLVEYAIALVAVLTVGQVFVSENEHSRSSNSSTESSQMNGGGDLGSEDELASKPMTHIERSAHQFGGYQGKSDALLLMNLVGAFEYSGGTAMFCEENHLRYKSMLEIRALRTQLTAIIQTICPSIHVTLNAQMKPPTETDRILLRQLLLAGFCDHLALPHPNPPPQFTSKSSSTGIDAISQTKRFYYQTMVNAIPSCIDRTSIFRGAGSTPPALVFVQIQQGKSNVWMKCVTEVDLAWVAKICKSMCTFSKPMEHPAPKYDPKTDKILATVIPSIGKHEWEMPMIQIPLVQKPLQYYWFARFLLEGQIGFGMEALKPIYVTHPDSMTKETYQNQKKVRQLVHALMTKDVAAKESLVRAWQLNPAYLFEEISLWVQPQLVDSLRKQWPPLTHHIRLDV